VHRGGVGSIPLVSLLPDQRSSPLPMTFTHATVLPSFGPTLSALCSKGTITLSVKQATGANYSGDSFMSESESRVCHMTGENSFEAVFKTVN
jgi:hypothetical protein